MQPLEGIRVLDLTHVLAGPFCTYQLAVLGADVIKIEDPNNPDMTRAETVISSLDDEQYGTYFIAQNAGKRAIALDLKTEHGRSVLTKLIETADVLVQNFAGDALENLGFGYKAASAINPKLIYCTLSGFGRTGHKKNHPAYDVVIQAYSGLMAANGSEQLGPTRVGPPMVDYSTGAQAALAVTAALFQRQRTDKGQFIDVAMLDAALMMMSASVVDTIATGKPPTPHGNIHPTYAGYRTYETSQGLIMIGAWTNKQLSSLMGALGETDRAAEILTTDRKTIGEFLASDTALISGHMLSKTADEWEVILNDAHVPAAKVRTIDEALASPQVVSRKVLQKNPNQIFDGVPKQLPVSAFSYAYGGPSIKRPPPKFGEHTEEVLKELGFGEEETESFGTSRKS